MNVGNMNFNCWNTYSFYCIKNCNGSMSIATRIYNYGIKFFIVSFLNKVYYFSFNITLQESKIYILKFKIVLRTIDKTLNMFPENSQIKYISSPLTVKQNGIKIFEENDRQFPLYSDEYQTDKEIKMRYFNDKWKEKGTVVLAIDPNNPDKMTWSYTTRDKIGGNIGDPTFNRGVQKTPTHLVFYRKTE